MVLRKLVFDILLVRAKWSDNSGGSRGKGNEGVIFTFTFKKIQKCQFAKKITKAKFFKKL